MRGRLRFSANAAAILWLILAERSVWGLLTLAAVLLHEAGHWIAARCLHIPTGNVCVGTAGVRIMLADGLLSYRAEALIAGAGPAVNLISAVFAVLLYRVRPDDGLLFFSAASLCLGGINLLPLPTFDGGRILAAVLCTLMGPDYADPLLAAAEAVGTALIWLIASALILRTGGNITLTVLAALLIWRMMSGYR